MPTPKGLTNDVNYYKDYGKAYYAANKSNPSYAHTAVKYARHKYRVSDAECELYGETHIKEFGRLKVLIAKLKESHPNVLESFI